MPGTPSEWQRIVTDMRTFILVLALSCLILAAAAGPCAAVQASPAEIAQLRVEVRELKTKLTDQAEAHASQANAFTADATDISIAGALSVLLVTLGGLAAALLGYRFIQSKVGEHLRTNVDEAVKAHGQQVFEREAGALHAEYDAKFAELYKRAHKVVGPE
jgi:hypothetical protein